jgi:hypothetical protein
MPYNLLVVINKHIGPQDKQIYEGLGAIFSKNDL